MKHEFSVQQSQHVVLRMNVKQVPFIYVIEIRHDKMCQVC